MRPPNRLAILLLLAAACSSRDASKKEDGGAHVVRNGERGAWSESRKWRLDRKSVV